MNPLTEPACFAIMEPAASLPTSPVSRRSNLPSICIQNMLKPIIHRARRRICLTGWIFATNSRLRYAGAKLGIFLAIRCSILTKMFYRDMRIRWEEAMLRTSISMTTFLNMPPVDSSKTLASVMSTLDGEAFICTPIAEILPCLPFLFSPQI